MKKKTDKCGDRRAAFLALMLLSPMANASDFRGFITVFLGFPSIIFCNLVLATLLLGFHTRVRKFRLLLLVPLYGVVLFLALCIASLSGMFVLDGPGSSDGWQSLVMFLAMVTSFFASLVTLVLLFRAYSGAEGDIQRRKNAAWSAIVLAVAASLPVAFDVHALMQKGGSNGALVGCYSVLFGTAMILHGFVVRLSSRCPAQPSLPS
nr:hypothetical protein [Dyella sp. ASV24]